MPNTPDVQPTDIPEYPEDVSTQGYDDARDAEFNELAAHEGDLPYLPGTEPFHPDGDRTARGDEAREVSLEDLNEAIQAAQDEAAATARKKQTFKEFKAERAALGDAIATQVRNPTTGELHKIQQYLDVMGTDLAAWWMEQTESEIRLTSPKAHEYGSRDLLEMGATLYRVKTGKDLDLSRGLDREMAIEMAVWFYMVGKMARWTAAIERGQNVSADTLFDIGIYTKMVQRSRVTGGVWPA